MKSIEHIVGRMMIDPRFRDQVKADPAGALASMDLSTEDREAIAKADFEELVDQAGKSRLFAKSGPFYIEPI